MFGIGSLPRWAAMWLLAVAIYAMLKLTSWLARRRSDAPAWKHALYLFAWPGMDVDAFLYGSRVIRPTTAEWAFAVAKFSTGLAILVVAVPALLRHESLPADLVGWLGMLGIVLVLHFGLFHVLSCAYRQCGIEAVPIMNRPLASHNLSEFWGKRWNLAFRDLTHRLLFRPTVRRLGPVGALLLAFLVSGLVHDAVISLPSGGRYGLPTVFFVMQGIAIVVERSRWGQAVGLGRGVRGWLFCLAVLLFASPMLFHPPFVLRVVMPFLRALGGV
jgi:alginate O-acetyltransferase complex protein AlgI